MITIDELKAKLGGMKTSVDDLRDALSIEASEKRLAELEHQMTMPGFYDDQARSQKIISEMGEVKNKLERFGKLKTQYEEAETLLEMIEEENDPALAAAFREVPREAFDAGTQVLWKLYDALSTPTLVIRGAESDLLTPEAAHAMQMRGPHAHVVEIAGAGHAPALDHAAEMQPIADFLLGSSGVSRV